MKSYFKIISLILLFSCQENNLKNLYPHFENITKIEGTNYYSLHNLSLKNRVDGIECILDSTGRLIQTRNWKDGKKEGFVLSYSQNSKVKTLIHYKNDTIDGDYYELDTLTGKILNYIEYINDGSGGGANQWISFENGRMILSKSNFIKIDSVKDDLYRIRIFTNRKYSNLNAYFKESDSDKYDYSLIDNIEPLKSDNSFEVYIPAKNKKLKYITGCLLNFNYNDKQEKNGSVTFFKIKK